MGRARGYDIWLIFQLSFPDMVNGGSGGCWVLIFTHLRIYTYFSISLALHIPLPFITQRLGYASGSAV